MPDAATWREYHERTKHSVESLRRSTHYLDWANMPDPFRHYEGVPVLDLPADPPDPESTQPALDGAAFLSQLLFYSAAISASKRVPSSGLRYALRVNPSSGNLHPTEFHFITRGLKAWPDGLYHYRPSSHMAEQRGVGPFDVGVQAPIVFVLTTIAWREAWKYQDRAYRYCLLDIGHAGESLAQAAGAKCSTNPVAGFDDDGIARICGLNQDEWPMLLIGLSGTRIPLREPDAGTTVWFGGRANALSERQERYALIERIHAATKLRPGPTPALPSAPRTGRGAVKLPPPVASIRSFGAAARGRRSALDFRGGEFSISLAQLSSILAATGPSRFVQLFLFVHRVAHLEPGVYRHWREPGELELIRAGDQRVAAAGLSLGQDLAGNACVAFSMIADLERATGAYGDRGYRHACFEAGAIGQRLYIAAEMAGLQATGIGAFYDDAVHRYLDLDSREGQVVYHFAIGSSVEDPRLEA